MKANVAEATAIKKVKYKKIDKEFILMSINLLFFVMV